MQQTIDGIRLHQLFVSGYYNLKKNMTAINDLNVFPVPDGDTGTNMVRTLGGLFSAGNGCEDVDTYMQNLSQAVLLAARGNSGVILSQFVHGLARGFAGKNQISFEDFAEAFLCAKEDSYKAVITPTEGTILTLIREAADYLRENASHYGDLETGFRDLIPQLQISLAKTPDLLPVLKEAGVVDSGGAGLLCFVEGIYADLRGESIEDTPDLQDLVATAPVTGSFGPDSVLEYGYCTEFILQLMHAKTDLKAFDIQAFIDALTPMGDSIVAVHNNGVVKIHIHTFTPEKVLAYAHSFGEFVTMKVENMSVQHSEAAAPAPRKEQVKYAVAAVASGEGIIEYFRSIGVDAVINGGQTSNPSVKDFLEAFDTLSAEHIIVLPNNSNIIFTANQAAELYEKARVTVIPTKSIVEGYSAVSMMDPSADTVEELVADMSGNLEYVTTGYVTAAIRDAVLEGKPVKEGEYMGLADKTLLTQGDNRLTVAKSLIQAVMEETPKDVIIVFTGEGVSAEEAAALEGYLGDTYPLCDIGFVDGRQAVYDFIISLE